MKRLSGGLFLSFMLTLAFLKSIMGYYILSGLEYTIFDTLFLLFTATLALLLVWKRSRQFSKHYLYFSLYLLVGLIHTVGNNIQPAVLLSSQYYLLVKVSTLTAWVIVLLLSFNNADKFVS